MPIDYRKVQLPAKVYENIVAKARFQDITPFLFRPIIAWRQLAGNGLKGQLERNCEQSNDASINIIWPSDDVEQRSCSQHGPTNTTCTESERKAQGLGYIQSTSIKRPVRPRRCWQWKAFLPRRPLEKILLLTIRASCSGQLANKIEKEIERKFSRLKQRHVHDKTSSQGRSDQNCTLDEARMARRLRQKLNRERNLPNVRQILAQFDRSKNGTKLKEREREVRRRQARVILSPFPSVLNTWLTPALSLK